MKAGTTGFPRNQRQPTSGLQPQGELQEAWGRPSLGNNLEEQKKILEEHPGPVVSRWWLQDQDRQHQTVPWAPAGPDWEWRLAKSWNGMRIGSVFLLQRTEYRGTFCKLGEKSFPSALWSALCLVWQPDPFFLHPSSLIAYLLCPFLATPIVAPPFSLLCLPFLIGFQLHFALILVQKNTQHETKLLSPDSAHSTALKGGCIFSQGRLLKLFNSHEEKCLPVDIAPFPSPPKSPQPGFCSLSRHVTNVAVTEVETHSIWNVWPAYFT